MSNLIPKLKHRIIICTPVQTPASDGSIEFTYSEILSCWAGIETVGRYFQYVRPLRGVNSDIEEVPTHDFIIRKNSAQIGAIFGPGFGDGFDEAVDLNPVKTDMFIFLQGDATYKGRRFKVLGTRLDENWKEYIKIESQEMFEEGTGWGRMSI